MKHKTQNRADNFRRGLLNRPLFERAAVAGVAALVVAVVAYFGTITNPGDLAAARPPTLNTAVRSADDEPERASLTINGENFEPGATVKLGENPVHEVIYISSSTLRAVTTLQPSAGDMVMVTNPDGQSAVLAGVPQVWNEPDTVNAMDLSILMSNIGREYPEADYRQDGVVDVSDLAVLVSDWTW
jgi:hypothetical protein